MASSAANPAAGAWDFECLGKRLPRSLRHARDLSTARRIVATAENIFADEGLAGARMDEIARAAKVNKALLYYYFRSKEELHRFVLEALLSQLQVNAVAASRHTPGERLLLAVDHYFDFVQKHPNYPRLIQREIMSRGPNLEWIISEYYRPMMQRLVQLIEDGVANDAFRKVDARNAALTVVSIMTHYFAAEPVLRGVFGHDPMSPAEVAKRRAAVHDFIEHGLFRQKAGAR